MQVVILQPFYLPYAGVFEMARIADYFVVYDDVQFMKRNWQSRNRIKTQNGPKWLTVPVSTRSYQPINTVQLSVTEQWSDAHLDAIQRSYAGRPGVDTVLSAISPVLEDPPNLLLDLNRATFDALLDILDVQVDIMLSSSLNVSGRSSNRILEICKSLGATSYLSGPSGRNYLDETSFVDAGIELQYFTFNYPEYSQPFGEFIPSLSVVDLIACAGEGAGKLIAGSGASTPAAEFT